MPILPPIREQCIEIMSNLMKHPCSKVFLQPADQPKSSKSGKRSIDLVTIKGLLESGSYQSTNAWQRDMSLIWTSVEKMYVKDSCWYILAHEIKRKFEKEYKRLCSHSMHAWTQRVSKLKDRLDSLLDEPPDPLTKYAVISEKTDSNQTKPLTEEEIDQFIKGSMLLSSAEDAKKMLRIIKQHEPRFQGQDENEEIDVGSLAANTLIALKNYVAKRLEELNVPFPK